VPENHRGWGTDSKRLRVNQTDAEENKTSVFKAREFEKTTAC